MGDGRRVVHVLSAVRGRPRFRAVTGVGDEGGVGGGECSLRLLRAPVMLRVVLPVPDRS
jgi:hypothetical protein